MAERGSPPHPDILTPREWEVLGLLRECLTNPEIGERLGISLAGARYHVSEIMGKLAGTTKLSFARLDNNQISDISVLSGLTGLTSVSLQGNPINCDDPTVIAVLAVLASRSVTVQSDC